MIHIVSEIFGEACRGLGADKARDTAAAKGDHCQCRQKRSRGGYVFDAVARLDAVDKIGGNKGDKGLDDRLQNDEDESDDHRTLVFPNATGKGFQHFHGSFLSG